MSDPMVEPVKRERTEPVYVLRGGAFRYDEFSGVLIDSAGNFSAKTRGNPLGFAAVLEAVAESIRYDVAEQNDQDKEIKE